MSSTIVVCGRRACTWSIQADMLAPKCEPRTVIRPFGWIVAASLANAQELSNRDCVTGTEFVFWKAIHCEPYIIPPYSVRPNGAVHQWRKEPPRELSVGSGS